MWCTGVNLSKILGGQTKILGGRWYKVINAWAFLNYWGHVPELPPKSTPMVWCARACACPCPFVRVRVYVHVSVTAHVCVRRAYGPTAAMPTTIVYV